MSQADGNFIDARYAAFVSRIVDEGIAAAMQTYADDPNKSDGAVAGFEACRGQTPEQMVALWQEAVRKAQRLLDEPPAYWHWTCYASEIEWVLNCVSALENRQYLSWLPTARGAMQASRVLQNLSNTRFGRLEWTSG